MKNRRTLHLQTDSCMIRTSKAGTSLHLAEDTRKPFHTLRGWQRCQGSPAVNQRLVYAWQLFWMLNEDPPLLISTTLLASCQPILWLWSVPTWLWSKLVNDWFLSSFATVNTGGEKYRKTYEVLIRIGVKRILLYAFVWFSFLEYTACIRGQSCENTFCLQ